MPAIAQTRGLFIQTQDQSFRPRTYPLALLFTLTLTLGGCADTMESSAASSTVSPTAPSTPPSPATDPLPTACQDSTQEPVRRLSAFEYARALDALVGVQVNEGTLPPTSIDTIFATEEKALGSSSLLVDGQFAAAEAAAHKVLATLESGEAMAFIGCDTSLPNCVDEFIARFGKKAFRRPVSADEQTRLRALYDQVVPDEGVHVALATIVQAIVLSPRFGFHVEERTSTGALDGWSIAARLSFFLWASAPDDQLMALAETGELADPAVREAQARRMLTDQRARQAVVRFYRELLDLDQLDAFEPLAEAYPNWTDTLRDEIFAETDRFVEATVFEHGGSFETLLTSRWVEAGPELSGVYGIEFGGNELPPERAGLLTRAGFLATKSHKTQPSPVYRGLSILDRFLCREIAPPPPDIPEVTPDQVTQTNRERYAAHSNDPACAGCHSQIDPLGFALEAFDAIGASRTHDNGMPVDATGEVFGTAIDGGAELSIVLANSAEVEVCAATQWVRFMRGHPLQNHESCARDLMVIESAAAGGTVQDLLITIVRSKLFIQ